MVKKATSGVLVMLLLFSLIGFNWPSAKAQTATPSQAVITVSGVPTGTKGLTVEVTVDTAVITLGSASTDVSGALAASDSMSAGVGILNFGGDLPASFTITVPLVGVAVGMSSIAVGKVLTKLGGTEIAGAMASVSPASATVASSSTSTTSSTSSSGGGAGGALSADTISIAINGTAVNQTSAVNVTVAFSDETVATLDTAGIDVTGMGITKLLTEVMGNVISAVWNGNTTDGVVTITAMLKAGAMAGTTDIGVTKVEAAGGLDITSSVAPTVTPSMVTNSASTSSTSLGTFSLIGPTSVVGPGKTAVAFSVKDGASGLSATLNGKAVDLVSMGAGVAIISIGTSDVALKLAVMAGSKSDTVDLGSLKVSKGSGGKPPTVSSVRAQNKSSSSILRVLGTGFSRDTTSLEIIPTDHAAKDVKVKGKIVKATYDVCIPNGSYLNVSTAAGTNAKKIKVTGSCSSPLVQ